MMPMSLDLDKSTFMTCCSKVICKGCDHSINLREAEESLRPSCPFCRTPIPSNDKADEMMMKRMEANDPVAIRHEGYFRYKRGDYRSAYRYLMKSAGLGEMDAHYRLSVLYHKGHGVEKDIGMEMYHLEEAAIGGHPAARYNLGCHEWKTNDNDERAVKHWIIAAKLGHDDSIKALLGAFRSGMIIKEILAAALRAHQAAVDATKSPQREEAEEVHQNLV